MKFRKLLLLILSVLLCIIFFTACSAEPEILSTPSDLKINGSTLTWKTVKNASSYLVQINNDTPVNIGNLTEYSLAELALPGIYTVKVMAKGDGKKYTDSAWSKAVEYPERLSEPYLQIVDGTTVKWDIIKNADCYNVQVDNDAPVNNGSLTEFSLAGITELGLHTVKVSAKNNNGTYVDSNWSQIDYWCGTSGLSYMPIGNGEYYVSKGTEEITGEIYIAAYYNGSAVTNILTDGFKDCVGLTGITIPHTLKGIGINAFYGCTGLTDIVLPDSVSVIGNRAFYNCTGLKEITMPNEMSSISESAFYGCNQLKSILLPDGIEQIESKTFFNCTALSNVIIPDSVMFIRDSAFYGCEKLAAIELPDNLIKIEGSAFYGCTSLNSPILPNSVISVGNNAFFATSWYDNQPDGLVYIGKIAYKYKGIMQSNTTIHITAGTVGIADFAFFACTGLTNIIIPDSVVSIGNYALLSTTWYDNQPDGVVYAGKMLYKYKGIMQGNTTINILSDTIGIADYAFDNCTGLRNVVIPETLQYIGNYAFKDCTNLEKITIPLNTIIGYEVFADCVDLKIWMRASNRPLKWDPGWNHCTPNSNIYWGA